MNMVASRRKMLTGALGVAAMAATPKGLLSPLDDTERFLQLARTGVVENEVFVIRQPIFIRGLPSLVVRNCRFDVLHDDIWLNVDDVGKITIMNVHVKMPKRLL